MEPESNTQPSAAFSEKYHAHVGMLLGVLIIVLMLIFGGLYLWGSYLRSANVSPDTTRTIPNNEPETARAVADRDIMMTTSASNEIDAIYADLESTNLDSLDSELDQIEIEMNAATR